MSTNGVLSPSVGTMLFGSEEALETWWRFSCGFMNLENTMKVIQTLLHAPFSPCFHSILNTHFFMPFGMSPDVSHHIYIDLFSAPEPMVAALAPLIPHLRTKSWNETRRDSEIGLIVDVDWEMFREPLLDHYIKRLKEASSDPQSVETWFNKLKSELHHLQTK